MTLQLEGADIFIVIMTSSASSVSISFYKLKFILGGETGGKETTGEN
jgi:hypothetical protein